MKKKTREGLYRTASGLFEMFVNVWFFMWLFWALMVMSITNASEVLQLEYWIIAELLVMIGFMISTKIWMDSF